MSERRMDLEGVPTTMGIVALGASAIFGVGMSIMNVLSPATYMHAERAGTGACQLHEPTNPLVFGAATGAVAGLLAGSMSVLAEQRRSLEQA